MEKSTKVSEFKVAYMTELSTEPAYKLRRRQWAARATFALCGLLAVLAGIYGIGRLRGNPADAECRPAVNIASRLAPLARGEVAAFAVAKTPFRVPDIAFKDAAGHDKTLADWRGRTVLLNLWATWCVPCRKEMPALAALQQKLGGPSFEVVAVNIDTRDPDKPKAWLQQAGVTGLAYYADASAHAFQELKAIGKAVGMPTSLLIDGAGCEIASLAGPAEWASDDALALVRAALQK
jgi:thiol-disulfide isomerase/thioredoxin